MTKIKIDVSVQKNSKTNVVITTRSQKGSIGLSVSNEDVDTGKLTIQSAMSLGLKDAMRLRGSLDVLIKNFEKI